MLIESVFFLAVGLFMLSYGSDWFVLGASRVAKQFNISSFVIGATIVAFGTSLPEIVTSAYAASTGSVDLAVGNALGSCIANIGLVLGLSLIISSVFIKSRSVLKNGYLYMVYTIIFTIIGYNGFSFLDGVFLLLLLALYVIYTIKSGEMDEDEHEKSVTFSGAIFYLAIGLSFVILGSSFFVDGAKGLATAFGISEKIIGFTIVAFGTSLPELAVSFAAAKQKLGGIVIGNVIGSNIANMFGALAIASLIHEIPAVKFELSVNILMVFLLLILMNKEKIKAVLNLNSTKDYLSEITKIDGLILMLIYLLFVLGLTGIF
ncbi:Na+/Ca+ antiporter, CaCA family [Methanococcus maripaludis C5]|uniref:Na+/Ca+ antiporter, CaCA family n=1 Tax=Methanococcus maripaludis (strain C5 / ATCC BAA-1333) TaxID=402880 RepID=A4FXA6_METM5|nr:calcium/sodium antiporter [Methanococcus maripaludis]ABO34835.1 Na+/Ca+ antiporter, CaCA family [Methanococcus maripaludis C5]